MRCAKERLTNLTTLPRNAIGDRAGPRYQLKTFRLTLRACELGATVDSTSAAVPVLSQILSRLDADQEHFIVLALDTMFQVTGFKVVSSGLEELTPPSPPRARICRGVQTDARGSDPGISAPLGAGHRLPALGGRRPRPAAHTRAPRWPPEDTSIRPHVGVRDDWMPIVFPIGRKYCHVYCHWAGHLGPFVVQRATRAETRKAPRNGAFS